jgi:arginase
MPVDRPIVIIQAPSGLGLETPGVEGLSGRLLELGLADALNARLAEPVAPPEASGEVDAQSGVLNAHALADYSPRLADAIGPVLVEGAFPLILGGDCSILLGSALALRRRGRFGLLFVDGNADFFQPEANPNGEAASMDLAFATGRGPVRLTDLEGLGPSIRAEDVVAFGWRDHADQAEYGSQPLPPEMGSFDLPAIRAMGLEAAVDSALDRLVNGATDGFLIHLDADVLDDAVMPAVDYRIEGGLSLQEVERLLTRALESGRAIGMEVAIYNPALDGDGARASDWPTCCPACWGRRTRDGGPTG